MPPRRRRPTEPFHEKFAEYGTRIAVDDGIAARSRRGAIGSSWWSGRFLAVLEALGVGGRLDRGKTYARAGQVIDLTISPGEILATVQGSRPAPYRTRIGITTFADEAWEAVESAFAADSWYAASLLGGTVPDDLEDVFAHVGLSLFPTTAREMPMDCSCPDWSVPCKHLAAVAYLVAERFDDDPFLILAWRGRDRTALLAGIRDRREDTAPAVTPLSSVLDRFWSAGGPLPELGGGAAAGTAEELLDQMPPLGVDVGGADAREALRPLYRRFGS